MDEKMNTKQDLNTKQDFPFPGQAKERPTMVVPCGKSGQDELMMSVASELPNLLEDSDDDKVDSPPSLLSDEEEDEKVLDTRGGTCTERIHLVLVEGPALLLEDMHSGLIAGSRSGLGPIQVFVKANNNSYTVGAHPQDSVLTFKRHFEARTGFPTVRAYFEYEGRVMQDHELLAMYNVGAGSTINCRWRILAGVRATDDMDADLTDDEGAENGAGEDAGDGAAANDPTLARMLGDLQKLSPATRALLFQMVADKNFTPMIMRPAPSGRPTRGAAAPSNEVDPHELGVADAEAVDYLLEQLLFSDSAFIKANHRDKMLEIVDSLADKNIRYYMLKAVTQSGKSPAIVFLAWVCWFRYHCLPWVFVKNAGGEEQVKSTWTDKVEDLNTKVTAILEAHPKIGTGRHADVYKRFHLGISHKVFATANNQVVFNNSNAPGFDKFSNLKDNILERYHHYKDTGQLRCWIFIDEDHLNIQSSDGMKPGVEAARTAAIGNDVIMQREQHQSKKPSASRRLKRTSTGQDEETSDLPGLVDSTSEDSDDDEVDSEDGDSSEDETEKRRLQQAESDEIDTDIHERLRDLGLSVEEVLAADKVTSDAGQVVAKVFSVTATPAAFYLSNHTWVGKYGRKIVELDPTEDYFGFESCVPANHPNHVLLADATRKGERCFPAESVWKGTLGTANARQACPGLFGPLDELRAQAAPGVGAIPDHAALPQPPSSPPTAAQARCIHLAAFVADSQTAVANYFCSSLASSAESPLVVVQNFTKRPYLHFSPQLKHLVQEQAFRVPQVCINKKLGETYPDEAAGSAITEELANSVWEGRRCVRGRSKVLQDGALVELPSKIGLQAALKVLATWQQDVMRDRVSFDVIVLMPEASREPGCTPLSWLQEAWPEQAFELQHVVPAAVKIDPRSRQQQDMRVKHRGMFQMLGHMAASPWERRALAYCEVGTSKQHMLAIAAQEYYGEQAQARAGLPAKKLLVLQHNTSRPEGILVGGPPDVIALAAQASCFDLLLHTKVFKLDAGEAVEPGDPCCCVPSYMFTDRKLGERGTRMPVDREAGTVTFSKKMTLNDILEVLRCFFLYMSEVHGVDMDLLIICGAKAACGTEIKNINKHSTKSRTFNLTDMFVSMQLGLASVHYERLCQVMGRITGIYPAYKDPGFRPPRLWCPESLFEYFEKTSKTCNRVFKEIQNNPGASVDELKRILNGLRVPVQPDMRYGRQRKVQNVGLTRPGPQTGWGMDTRLPYINQELCSHYETMLAGSTVQRYKDEDILRCVDEPEQVLIATDFMVVKATEINDYLKGMGLQHLGEQPLPLNCEDEEEWQAGLENLREVVLLYANVVKPLPPGQERSRAALCKGNSMSALAADPAIWKPGHGIVAVDEESPGAKAPSSMPMFDVWWLPVFVKSKRRDAKLEIYMVLPRAALYEGAASTQPPPPVVWHSMHHPDLANCTNAELQSEAHLQPDVYIMYQSRGQPQGNLKWLSMDTGSSSSTTSSSKKRKLDGSKGIQQPPAATSPRSGVKEHSPGSGRSQRPPAPAMGGGWGISEAEARLLLARGSCPKLEVEHEVVQYASGRINHYHLLSPYHLLIQDLYSSRSRDKWPHEPLPLEKKNGRSVRALTVLEKVRAWIAVNGLRYIEWKLEAEQQAKTNSRSRRGAGRSAANRVNAQAAAEQDEVVLGPDTPAGHAGFQNNGAGLLRNVCWLNSLLQALLHQPRIVLAIARGQQEAGEQASQLGARLEELACHMGRAGVSSIGLHATHAAVHSVVRGLRIDGQNDPHEVFLALAQELPLLGDLFKGHVEQCMHCPAMDPPCLGSTPCLESIFGLELCIPPDLGPQPVSLEVLLQYNLPSRRAEELEWRCGACRRHCREGYKTRTMRSPPFLLMVRLGREVTDKSGRNAVKVMQPVAFPLLGLDMTPYCGQQQGRGLPAVLYDCRAVIQHHGHSLDSGHFTAMAKAEDGRWLFFDDDQEVCAVGDSRVQDPGLAYMLIYELHVAPLQGST